MGRLTEEMVLARTRAASLSAVQNLNLWGSDLDDVSVLRELSSVRVLSLSVNKIHSLASFQPCRELVELYLRKNAVADPRELRHLQRLAHLRTLWLSENPIAERHDYRDLVVAYLPQLEKLDNQVITAADHARAEQLVVRLKAAEDEHHRQRSDGQRSTPTPGRLQRAKSRAVESAPERAHEEKGNASKIDVRTPRDTSEKRSREARKPVPAHHSPRSTSSRNVLTAMFALLNDIHGHDLRVLHAKIEERMTTEGV